MNRALAWSIRLAFVAAALFAVVVFARAVRDGEHRRSPDALVQLLAPNYTARDRTAPDFELTDGQGRRHRLSQYRGRVVVLHFWTRTCEPCIVELQRSLPGFEEVIAGRNNVALLLVTVDPDWQSVAPLIPRSLSTPVLFDPTRRVVDGKYGTRLFPETWVIDPEGVIRARFDHPVEWDSPLFLNYLASLAK